MRRFRSLVNRLLRNPVYLRKDDAVIQHQSEKGIIEAVPEEDSANTLKHYIPHHEIVTPENTTKTRIVFDSSAKTRKGNRSLNESLHRGPIILEDLCVWHLWSETSTCGQRCDKINLAKRYVKAYNGEQCPDTEIYQSSVWHDVQPIPVSSHSQVSSEQSRNFSCREDFRLHVRREHDQRNCHIGRSQWILQRSKDPFPVLIDESSCSPEHPWKWTNKCRHYVSPLD